MPAISVLPLRRALSAAGVVLAAGIGGGWLAVAPAAGAPAAGATAYAPHQVIVGYRRTGSRRAAERADLSVGAVSARPQSGGAHTVTRLLRLPRHETVSSALTRLRHQPGVAYAQPNYLAHQAGAFYPDDPGRGTRAGGWAKVQWNLLPGAGVDAPLAWSNLIADGRAGGRGVTVAVIDTGVAYRNWGKFRKSPDFNNTRFVDPYDFINDNTYPLDREGHGTFVAAAIAESTNNGIGLTGLAYGVSIMPLRVLNSDGSGRESAIADAIRFAIAHHAQIINLSLEFLPNQVSSVRQIPLIVSAVNDARRHHVMVVGAAGNDEADRVDYPARLPGVVSVGATTRDRCVASYSNAGPSLDLVAPGGGSDAISATDPDCHPERVLPSIYQMTLTAPPHWGEFGYPGYYIGTSMSAPEVSAAAALVIASRILGPHPSPDQVLNRLEQTATPLPVGAAAPNDTYGYGLLNAGAATSPLTATVPTTTTTTPTTTTTTPTTTTTTPTTTTAP